MEKKIIYKHEEKGEFEVTFNYDTLNIHIEDSRKLYSKKLVEEALTYIHSTEEYKELVAAGYTRTYKSQLDEWRAHNVMWSWGYKRSQTGSVDLDQNESSSRKFIYSILAILG